MKHFKRSFLLIICIILSSLFLIPNINANPVAPTPYSFSISYFIICIFGYFLTISCEYGLGFLMIPNLKFHKLQFIKLTFSVNSFTYPLTQLFAYFFYLITAQQYLKFLILALEFIVIISEWLLISKFFKNYNQMPHLDLNHKYIRIFAYSLTANLVTYLLGAMIFLLIIPYYGPFFF